MNSHSDKNKLLLKIQQAGFAICDMRLYLDTHPHDIEICRKMEIKHLELEKLKEEYEKDYGKLTCSNKPGEKYSWLSEPWPWEHDDEEKFFHERGNIE